MSTGPISTVSRKEYLQGTNEKRNQQHYNHVIRSTEMKSYVKCLQNHQAVEFTAPSDFQLTRVSPLRPFGDIEWLEGRSEDSRPSVL